MVKVSFYSSALSRLYVTFFASAFTLILGSCVDSKSNDIGAQQDWVKDEVVLQLAELRKEIRFLKESVSRLEGLVTTSGNPSAEVVPNEVKINSENILGNARADLAIIEFSDYQCPFCSRHNGIVLPEIREKLVESDKVKYVMYDFPL